MNTYAKLAMICLILFLTTSQALAKVPGFQRATNKALREAKRLGKPVVIDFGAQWCPWCKKLEAETLSDREVQKALQSFVALKVDMTRPKKNERAFARKFGVEGLPTVAFINSKGTELKELKLVGFTPASKFLKLLKKVK